MKKAKCALFQPSVEYLGHKVNSEGIHITSVALTPNECACRLYDL